MKVLNEKSIPVCFLGEDKLIVYKLGDILIYNTASLQLEKTIPLFSSFKERYLSRIRIFSRLFRTGIRCSIPISNTQFVFYLNRKIYEYDILYNRCSTGYMLDKGIRPLYFSKIESVLGFDDMFVFGGYLSNNEKKKVSIYRRLSVDSWDIIYSFSEGYINHIHNIIGDPVNKCVWILTGDFDNSAAIWIATDNFKTVRKVFSGNQNYRSCIAFPLNGGLLYATDSQLKNNTIRFLYNKDGEWEIKPIMNIEGSCIYGCKCQDDFIFATTVEGIGLYKNIFEFVLDRKPGPGIKNNRMYLYKGNIDKGFNKIYSLEKDIWPFIFQFGSIHFPSGINNNNYIIFKPVASSIYDQDIIVYPF